MFRKENIRLVVIGGSAGSYNVVSKILSSVPADFPLPIIFCLHRLKDIRNGFVESLNLRSGIMVKEPFDKDPVRPGCAYLSPSNYHLLIEPGRTFALSVDENVNYSRPSIDLTFETAGYVYKDKMAAILLSGANSDGARGLYSAFRNGAYTIIQDPDNAHFKTMPVEAMKYFTPHKKCTADEIVDFVTSLKENRNV